MARNSQPLRFFDFTGGLNSKSPVTTVALNQATDLQNINLLPTGGFEKRRGNTAFNSSAMNSGANVQGLGYFQTAAAVEYMMAIAGEKAFKSDDLDGTMDDITGSVTITAGQNNIWTHSVMNDWSIFVGGAPDAPIVWKKSGNMAALGGSPPSGNFGFTHNRRFFIGNTTANPSRLAWSTLSNPEDWSGAGSGNSDIQDGDGDTLVCGVPMDTDKIMLFKQNSMHVMNPHNTGTTAIGQFPVFRFASGIGCAGKHAWVVVDGVIYFVTPTGRMMATDGDVITPFPDFIDDIWDSTLASRRKYITGAYNSRLGQIMWSCSVDAASTNNYCIVWDLKRKAWLRNPTGHKMNIYAVSQDGTVYGGAYDGKIYKQDVSGQKTDASESSGTIDAYWRSGWIHLDGMIESKYFPYMDISFTLQSGAGTLDISYGFDFSQDRKTETFSILDTGSVYGTGVYGTAIYGGQGDGNKLVHTKGQGKFFQYRIRNAVNNESFSVNGFEIPVKKAAPSALGV